MIERLTERLKTPLGEEVLKLRAGDIVELNGTIYTARDRAHMRMIEKEAPVELEGAVIYHCGPLAINEDGVWRVVSAGPTTSERMAYITEPILKKGVRAIVGKGGMSTAPEILKGKGVYLSFCGGCGALAASFVKRAVPHWLELGMPEAMWELDVEGFGPLIVSVDSTGNSLYEKVRKTSKQRLDELTRD
jgi:fumarate hydratase subunit beta